MVPRRKATPEKMAVFVAKRRTDYEKAIEGVQRHERMAKEDPDRFARQLRRSLTLGYVYLGLVTLGSVGLVVLLYVQHGRKPFVGESTVVSSLGAVAISTIWTLLRRDRKERLRGVPLSRDQAPVLYAEVDDIAHRLGAATVDRIVLDARINAGAHQSLRWRFFGRATNRLLLGVPILHCLDTISFRAVVAHELAHLDASHSAHNVKAKRFVDALRNIDDRSRSGFPLAALLVQPVFSWWLPNFLYAHAVAQRQHEYAADRAVTSLVSRTTCASALLRLRAAERNWRCKKETEFDPLTLIQPAPPSDFFEIYCAAAAIPCSEQESRQVLHCALGERADFNSTHPSFRERMTALGVNEAELETARRSLIHPVFRSAFDLFLGERAQEPLNAVKAKFETAEGNAWKRRHQNIASLFARLKDLQANKSKGANRARVLCEAANIVLAQGDAARAELLFGEALVDYPEDRALTAGLAAALLRQDKREGVPLMEATLQTQSDGELAGIENLMGYYGRIGEGEHLASLRIKQVEAKSRQEYLRSAFTDLHAKDKLLPSILTKGARESIRATLQAQSSVRDAYLFRKELPEFARERYLLCVFPHWPSARFVERLRPKLFLPNNVELATAWPYWVWRKRLNSIPGAKLFDPCERLKNP